MQPFFAARLIAIISCTLLIFYGSSVFAFGFHAHRVINRMAVFTLPPDMLILFKNHIEFLAERSIDPDRRAHVAAGEAPRHFLDADHYGSYPFVEIPRELCAAENVHSADTLQKYGVLPWAIEEMFEKLTRAFERMEADQILIYSAHLGHYIADACTPLHTTLDYNGRDPFSRGIHALWETRVPELFSSSFHYLTGQAELFDCALEKAWSLILESHLKVDSIYMVFDSLMTAWPGDRVFSHEMRGQTGQRVFSADFTSAFHDGLDSMVERQMQLAVRAVGNYWYAAWYQAGSPDLTSLLRPGLGRSLQRFVQREDKLFDQTRTKTENPPPRW